MCRPALGNYSPLPAETAVGCRGAGAQECRGVVVQVCTFFLLSRSSTTPRKQVLDRDS